MVDLLLAIWYGGGNIGKSFTSKDWWENIWPVLFYIATYAIKIYTLLINIVLNIGGKIILMY